MSPVLASLAFERIVSFTECVLVELEKLAESVK